MKVFGTIMKIIAALAAVAGAIYLLATYGDKICAWARKIVSKFPCCCCCGDDLAVEFAAEQEEAVQAEEQDFEG